MSKDKLIVDKRKQVYFITEQSGRKHFVLVHNTIYTRIPKENKERPIIPQELLDYYFSDTPHPFAHSIIVDGKRIIAVWEPRD